MAIRDLIKTFDSTKIRVVWDDEKEKYYFSVVDVIGVLTESADARTYWKVLKHRLVKEGNESVTNCNQLKLLAADGKRYNTDVALTDLMSKVWSGMTTREYKEHKGLTSQNLRDNMTNMELLLNALAEQTATDLSKERDPRGIVEAAHVAKDGAEVARNARADIEHRLGHSVISDRKAMDYITPKDELPFEK